MIDHEQGTVKNLTDYLMSSLKNRGYPQIDACLQCSTGPEACPFGKKSASILKKIIRKIGSEIEEILSENDLWYSLENCPHKNGELVKLDLEKREINEEEKYYITNTM